MQSREELHTLVDALPEGAIEAAPRSKRLVNAVARMR
jgi:hypothetical protein